MGFQSQARERRRELFTRAPSLIGLLIRQSPNKAIKQIAPRRRRDYKPP